MKIQVASDLHLEFPGNREWIKKNPLIPEADILVLAGDIVVDKYKSEAGFFIDQIKHDYKTVISTMGNHEFYDGVISYAYPDYKKELTRNYIKLNNQSVIIDDTKFIASTLWSHIPGCHSAYLKQIMNDFRMIYKFNSDNRINITIDDINRFHKASVDFLKNELAKDFDGKVVVITHHLPMFECIEGEYNNKDIIKYAFATDLIDLIKNNRIDLWVFGHIHVSYYREIYNTRLVANPLGYMSESQQYRFSRDLVIEI